MTIVQRTVASFAGVLLLMLLACGYVLHGLWQLSEATEEQRRIARATEHAHFLDAALLQSILLLEQYVDIPDPGKLAALRDLRAQAAARRKSLRALTNLPRIVELIDAYDAVQPERTSLAERIAEAASAAPETLVALRQQRDALDRRVRGFVTEIVRIEDRAMAESAELSRSLAEDLRRNVLVLFIGIIGLTLVVAARSASGVSRRVVPLMEMARRVSAGDFTARASVEGRDEVATLAATMNRMATDLRELDAAKDEFVAIASHQLRTPATAVKGNLAMLLDGIFGEMTPEQREYLQDAYAANERQMEVIDAILNVARAETGRLQVEKGEVDLAMLVDGVVSEHRFEMAGRRQQLDWQKPGAPVTIAADAAKLRMVVDNLVSNAGKYTPDEGHIHVRLLADPEWVVLEVLDNGVGIAPEDQERLFRKFSRIDNPLSAVGGSGLGLFLAAEIVRLHGGNIAVESSAGTGSTFRIRLPRR